MYHQHQKKQQINSQKKKHIVKTLHFMKSKYMIIIPKKDES